MRQNGKRFITVKEVIQIWLFVWFSLEKNFINSASQLCNHIYEYFDSNHF